MGSQVMAIITKKGGVEISKEITDILGTELKSACINDVWLLIAASSDNRFVGEPLLSEGTTYLLPENQMLVLQISPGDDVKLVFSDVLETIIMLKLDNGEILE